MFGKTESLRHAPKLTNHHLAWPNFIFVCWFTFHSCSTIVIYAIATFLEADSDLELSNCDGNDMGFGFTPEYLLNTLVELIMTSLHL